MGVVQRGQGRIPRRGLTGTAAVSRVPGVTACMACFPLDLLRTRILADRSSSAGILETLRGILRNEGFGALYGGCLPALMSVGPSGAVFYGVYDLLKVTASRLCLVVWLCAALCVENCPQQRRPGCERLAVRMSAGARGRLEFGLTNGLIIYRRALFAEWLTTYKHFKRHPESLCAAGG